MIWSNKKLFLGFTVLKIAQQSSILLSNDDGISDIRTMIQNDKYVF